MHAPLPIPLHPIVNHFTIALVPASILSDFLARWTRKPTLASTAGWCLGYSAILAPLSAISGWMWLAEMGGSEHPQIQVHRALGTVLAILIPLLWVWRRRFRAIGGFAGFGYLAAGLSVLAVVGIQGWLGGEMTFGHEGEGRPHEPAVTDETDHRDIDRRVGGHRDEHGDRTTHRGSGDAQSHEEGRSSLRIEPVPGPASRPSSLPRFAASGQAGMLLWTAETNSPAGTDRAELQFSLCVEGAWQASRLIAAGEDWFVNWADVPAMAAVEGGRLLVTYLRRTGDRSYDYQIELIRSDDGGASWGAPSRLHEDAGPGEHGFVSLIPLDAGRCLAVWLDGRNARAHDEDGATGLFSREVAPDGDFGPELVLDERVCDCCPTAAARTRDGSVLVAYRDRSEDEVRDIALVRWDGRSPPRRLWESQDGWKIPGCPVNGPALTSDGDRVALAWFTLWQDGLARVRCALSQVRGELFAPPITLAQGRVEGRVDAVFDPDGRLIVSWLEAHEGSARWLVARVGQDGTAEEARAVASAAIGRESGIARLARVGDAILFVFTEPGPPPCVTLRRLVWE